MAGKVVLCLGDSHTRGLFGTDWVAKAQGRWSSLGLCFVREGVNGEVSSSVYKRLQPQIDRHGPPAAVILLAGTNDVIGQINSGFASFYVRHGRLSSPPTKQAFLDSIADILQTVAQQAPLCKVAVLTLPPLGEDLMHRVMQNVELHNAELKEVVAQYPNATIIDFGGSCRGYLQMCDISQRSQHARFSFTMWNFFLWQIGSLLQHYVLRQSWNAISRRRGLKLLTDQVHLNDTAGMILLKDLERFIRQLVQE